MPADDARWRQAIGEARRLLRVLLECERAVERGHGGGLHRAALAERLGDDLAQDLDTAEPRLRVLVTRARDDLVDLVVGAGHDVARARTTTLERRADERFVEQGADRVDVAGPTRRATGLDLRRDRALPRNQAGLHRRDRARSECEIRDPDAAVAADGDRLGGERAVLDPLERDADARDQISGAARAEPERAGLALLDQHVADERAVDLLGRDPQDVAGEPGGERAHEVLGLGERGGGARARDDLLAHDRVLRQRRVDDVHGRRATWPVRAIGVCDPQRPHRRAQHVLAELHAGLQPRRELRLTPRRGRAHRGVRIRAGRDERQLLGQPA